MVSYFAARTIAYSFVLFWSINGVVFGSFTTPPFQLDSVWKWVGWVCGVSMVVSALTMIWVCVLLGYNNQPRSRHILATAKAHYNANVAFASIWALLAVLLTIALPSPCMADYGDGEGPLICSFTAVDTAVAWLIFGISTYMALLIRRRSRVLGLDANIADAGNLQRLEDVRPAAPAAQD